MRTRALDRITDFLCERVEKLFLESQQKRLRKSLHHCGSNVIIYENVIFAGAEALDIGDNTSIAPFVHIWCGGRVIIGANCMIGSHVAITSLTHDYTESKMYNTTVAKPVVIEDEVWIGAHAVILPGTRVGRGAVIGAGSVVTRDIPPYSVAYGVPATVRLVRNSFPASKMDRPGQD